MAGLFSAWRVVSALLAAVGIASTMTGFQILWPDWVWWIAAYAILFAEIVQLQRRLNSERDVRVPSKFDMPIEDVLARMAGGSLATINAGNDGGLAFYSRAFAELRQLASDGILHAKAQKVRLANDPLQTLVSTEEWRASPLDLERYLERNEVRFANNERTNFQFAREQIHKRWRVKRLRSWRRPQ